MANIRIDDSTKFRIDALKGKKSYNDFIAEMVRYFEYTGIPPTSQMISPILAMKEHSDKMIRAIQGMEKKQTMALDAIYDLVKKEK
jgi:hypothetical protein